jgi:hypothetical protein
MNTFEEVIGSIKKNLDMSTERQLNQLFYIPKPTKKQIFKSAVDILLKFQPHFNDEKLVGVIINYCLLNTNPIRMLVTYYRRGVGMKVPKMYECISMLYYYESKYNKALSYLEQGFKSTQNKDYINEVKARQLRGMVRAIEHLEKGHSTERREALMKMPYKIIASILKLKEKHLLN